MSGGKGNINISLFLCGFLWSEMWKCYMEYILYFCIDMAIIHKLDPACESSAYVHTNLTAF